MFPVAKMNTTDLRSALQKSQVQPTAANQGKAYLKFEYTTGDFLFGKEQVDVTGDELVVNVATFAHGWVLWANRKANKVYAPFTQPLPEQLEPVDGDYASEARAFEARFPDDEDTIVMFETSSYGGRKGCDVLWGQVTAKAVTSDFFFPVVKLTAESYKAKKGGIIHNPVFEVVGWVNSEGQREGQAQKVLAAQQAAKPVEEVEEVDDVQEAQPETRRRRRVE